MKKRIYLVTVEGENLSMEFAVRATSNEKAQQRAREFVEGNSLAVGGVDAHRMFCLETEEDESEIQDALRYSTIFHVKLSAEGARGSIVVEGATDAKHASRIAEEYATAVGWGWKDSDTKPITKIEVVEDEE